VQQFDDFSIISPSVRSWVFVVCADVVLFGGGRIAIRKCGIESKFGALFFCCFFERKKGLRKVWNIWIISLP
jgi:hypothetical protein